MHAMQRRVLGFLVLGAAVAATVIFSGHARTSASIVADDDATTAEAVRGLIEAVKDKDPEVRKRRGAGTGPHRQGSEGGRAGADRGVAQFGRRRRGATTVALGRIGKEARDSVANLIVLLKDKDRNVRGAAALALARIGEGKDAFKALSRMASEDDRLLQVYARCAWRCLTTRPTRTCLLWPMPSPTRSSKSAARPPTPSAS